MNSSKQESVPTEAYVSKNAKTFADFALEDIIKTNIAAKKYTTPTPIQDQAIPPILEGRDIIGIANTGTGKTAAFLLPLIQKVWKNPQEKVFIVTPTRELAVQIQAELQDYSRGMRMRSALLIGGMSMGRQVFDLRANPQFVIGTPGRIRDHLKSRTMNLSVFHTVVLDEADRMVDIGFITEIKYFISLLPTDRQSLFFSATISDKITDILRAFVKDPVRVSVRQGETASAITQQIVKVVDKSRKVDQLHDLLNQKGFDKVLIFGRTKWGIEKLTKELTVRGFKAGSIHGNKRQSQRQRTLDMFKRSEIQILLATDVASRGLDIHEVSHVINYDMPTTLDDYIHRIGRTGWANNSGTALTFVD
jgi:superfamily II DNA/RNA helicase